MSKPDLVLLTAGFPYDGSESVLRNELEVISERFARLFIVPSRRGAEMTSLPPSAEVADLGWTEGFSRSTKTRILSSQPASRVVARTLLDRTNWSTYLRGSRAYLDNLATNLLKAQSLQRWLTHHGLEDAVFYDYWFENATLALATLRQRGVIRCAVSRAHRFDVFDSSWADLGRVPFREYKARNLDAVFAVSEDAANYLRDRLRSDARKVHLARLGLPIPETYPERPAGVPVIVSCSALLPRKQVHLIPPTLARLDRALYWIHFGDGPDRERVEAAARGLPHDVTWELRGWVDNEAVRDFYSTHGVSSFLSLSASEGIPVSMMEAHSFGIPIVALGVGGIPELVTAKTGILLDMDAPTESIANAVARAIAPAEFDMTVIRSAFAERYTAATNYGAFADRLLSIWSARS
jgi:glycosyltransferase involved in cell wall biosynthesis